MKHPITKYFLIILSLFTTISWAETRYVTDEFKVTLRTGTSTSNSILTMLKSGAPVKVIEQDDSTKYTLVETKNGKQGYILSRFLDSQPSGRQLYSQLQSKSKRQKESIKTLKSNLRALKQSQSDTDNSLTSANDLLSATSDELRQLKQSTRNTIAIIEKNKAQQSLIQILEEEKAQLLAENLSYKESTAMDWFIIGASVSLLAFLLGIIVTRIRWTKRDSWGEF